MPFNVRAHYHIYCEEQLELATVGHDKSRTVVKHEVGQRSPFNLDVHKIWSLQKLVVTNGVPLVLDLANLPPGMLNYSKDLHTDQTLNLIHVYNETETDVTLQMLTTGGVPLPGVGYVIGPTVTLLLHDDEGNAILSSFITGMQFDVIAGVGDAELEIVLGTVYTPGG